VSALFSIFPTWTKKQNRINYEKSASLFGMNLNYSLSCQSLCLPQVTSDGCGFPVAACRAPLVAHMISSSAAAPAFNVNSFALAFAH
jgi:hypothetical protein